MFTPTVLAGIGLNPFAGRCTGIVYGGAVVRGQVLAFDLIKTYATNSIPGDAASSLVIVRPVYAAAAEGAGILGIAQHNAENLSRVELIIEGQTMALVQGDLGSLSAGAALYAVSGQAMLRNTTAAGRRCVAALRDAVSTPSAVLSLVDFSGIYGWGVAAA